MRLILAWLCLLSEAYPFPDNGGNDKHNSKMYEYGENKGLFSQTENGKQYEETITQTEEFNFYENSGMDDTENYFLNETLDTKDTDTKANTVISINYLQKNNIKKNSSLNMELDFFQNDTYIFDIHNDLEILNTATSPEGDGDIGPTVDADDPGLQRTNDGEWDGYYKMEGSAFIDVQNPTVHVPPTDKHDNFCKNSKKPNEEINFKLDTYATGVKSSIRRKTDGAAAAKETNMKNKKKGKNNFERSKSAKMRITNKNYITGKREKISNGHKQKSGTQLRRHQPAQKNEKSRRYRFSESSSESDSDSNQSFD